MNFVCKGELIIPFRSPQTFIMRHFDESNVGLCTFLPRRPSPLQPDSSNCKKQLQISEAKSKRELLERGVIAIYSSANWAVMPRHRTYRIYWFIDL